MSGSLLRLLRSQARSEAVEQHQTGGEFLAAKRFAGVADSTTAADVVVRNPTDDTDALIAVAVSGGGLAHLDVTDGATIDTSGTAFNVHEKGADNGTLDMTVEYGGTYSTTGDTIGSIIPGSSGKTSPTAVGGGETTDTRLLEPSDGVRYQITNESGTTVDYDVVVTVIQV